MAFVEEFALRYLAVHLAAGKKDERLVGLLSRFEFLRRKVSAWGLNELIADYDLLPPGSALGVVQSALRLSAPALEREPRELAGQLVGRLPFSSAEVNRLLREAESHAEGASLVPRSPSLIPATGGLRQALRAVGGAFSVSSEGRWVIAGGSRKIWVWDLTGARPLRSFAGPRSGVTAVALTPDDRWLITADSKGGLAIYLWESGQCSHRWWGHKGGTMAVAALADGRRFLSSGKDGLVKLWRLEGGRALRTFRGHTADVVGLAVTPDGNRLASGSRDGMVCLWDLTRESPARSLAGCPERVERLVGSPNGRFLIASGVNPEVVIWDWESGEVVRELPAPVAAPRLAISHDSQWLAISSGLELKLCDLPAAVESRVVARGMVGGPLAFLPSGDRLVNSYSGLREWDLTRKVVADSGPGSSSLAVTADGRYAVAGSADGTIAIWNLLSGHEEQRFSGSSVSLGSLALMPDGRQAFVGDRQGGLHRFDLWTGERLPAPRALEPGNAVVALALTSDGRHLVAGSVWGDVLVWDLEEERLIAEHRFEPSYLITLALIPSTSRAIVCCNDEDDQSPWVLDWQESRRLRRIGGRHDATLALAVSADGRRAATGGQSGSLKVWNLNGGSPKYFPGHTGGVNSAAFLPGGLQVVAVANEGTARVWDVASRKCLASFTGDSGFRRCAVAPDGRTIVVSGDRDELHFLRWRR
ncbi:MAG TPA: WD40 repeat domain-containing protein [Thermoanaerobaculia bacterium]|jgi:WD40 repeat protein|nr:WD40 repeat domain-containing protein [Thermoanaerobaculia bacterium]